ncbi:MAG: hypothetical protein VYD54_06380 [Bdellovibrionota bacterium]|nr:hypothetical protein [Bdellovibrionota bacterium]
MNSADYLKKLLRLLEVLVEKHRAGDDDMVSLKKTLKFSNPDQMDKGLIESFIAAKEDLLEVYFQKVFNESGVEGKIGRNNQSFIKFLEKESK